ncbi:prolyl-tRNA synthetase associated domain-containing protein [Maricaulis sp. CAU 1757]
MTQAQTDLFARLDALGILHETRHHPRVFTVEESRDIKLDIPGGHTKNLFLRDKKGSLFLVSALAETVIRLNRLHTQLGCGRLSFAPADLLQQHLGVTPGSVTALALAHDSDAQVRFVLDAALLEHDQVNFHPLSNDATTTLSSRDLVRFAEASGHPPTIIDFASLQADAAPAQ